MVPCRLILALVLYLAPLAAQPRTQPPASPVKPYTLPPGKYERAVDYSHWRYAIHFVSVLWTAGTLVAILNLRLAPRLRNRAERASVRRFVQAMIFVPGLMLAI